MAEYWQATIQLLQSPDNPLVGKPRLQESLLIKPPFRFLHDVISEVR
jgi:TRAF3-interacting protein 1